MAQKTDPNTEWLFGGEDDRKTWEAHRRFISPLFNSIYRQGVIGASHLPEADFAAFLTLARTDVVEATGRLLEWSLQPRPQGGDFSDLVIDRLVARAGELDAETALGVVAVFALFMDDYYRANAETALLIDTWRKSEDILQAFKRSIDGFDLERIAEDIATHGKSLSWMTNKIGRTELWSHGLAGNQPKDESLYLLGEQRLQIFLTTLLERITKLDKETFLALPNLLMVILTFLDSPWHKTRIRTVIRRFTGAKASDEDFLRFLAITAGTIVSSNRGVVRRIEMSMLEHLVGATTFKKRWGALRNKSPPPEQEAWITDIEQMMAESKNW